MASSNLSEEGSTIRLSDCDDGDDEHRAQDVGGSLHADDFARLVPLNKSAKIAFKELATVKQEDSSWLPHIRRFIHIEDDGDADDSGPRGYFRFSLSLLPERFALGWVVGTGVVGEINFGIDILLTLHGDRDDVRPQHMRFYHHRENRVLMLKPGPNKSIILNGEEIKAQSRVLPARSGIMIGNLAYRFEFTNSGSQYGVHLEELMRESRYFSTADPPQSLNTTPSSNNFVLRQYQFQTPLAAGAFGVVSPCVHLHSGDVFAAKRLNRTKKTFAEVNHEIRMLKKVRGYVRIICKPSAERLIRSSLTFAN